MRARAESVARAPLLRAAIETDADTLHDLTAGEALFAVAPGETIEVFLDRGERRELAVRLPAGSPPLVGAERLTGASPDGARLIGTPRGLAITVTVPVTTHGGQAGGTLAFAAPIDLGPFAGRVAHHAHGAALVGLGEPLIVTRAGAGRRGERVSVPVPFADGLAHVPVAIDATVAAIRPPAESDDDAYACFAIAGLLLLMAALRTADPYSRLDA